MTKGQLYNLALTYLGKPEYEAGTSEAQTVERVVQHCIGLALDYSTWTFATRSKVLELDEWDKCARLPLDCLRVQKVHADNFEIRGRMLYVDNAADEHVQIDYTTDDYVKNVYLPEGQPTFCEAVVLMLAAKIAPRVTSDFSLAMELEKQARAMLSKAKLKDARQVASNDQKPRLGADAWGISLPTNVLAE